MGESGGGPGDFGRNSVTNSEVQRECEMKERVCVCVCVRNRRIERERVEEDLAILGETPRQTAHARQASPALGTIRSCVCVCACVREREGGEQCV